MLLENLYRCCLCLFLVLGLPLLCLAQDLEPRRWSHLPTGKNFVGGGYSYTEADIFFDPVLRIEDVELEMHSWALKYIRTFELFQKSARIGLVQSYQEGRWSGLVDGVPSSVKRCGLSDSILRLAINLYGAPPLEGQEFVAYRAAMDVETIVGTALLVEFPTGDYRDDKLINLGTNRFTFRPQFGVVHKHGKWALELTGEVSLYTDNDDFFNGNRLETDPFYSLQSHLMYNFHPGLWAAVSAGYGYGGESSINGVDNDDRRENLSWAFSMGCPITRRLAAKAVYLGTRGQETVGMDSDSVALIFSFWW